MKICHTDKKRNGKYVCVRLEGGGVCLFVCAQARSIGWNDGVGFWADVLVFFGEFPRCWSYMGVCVIVV